MVTFWSSTAATSSAEAGARYDGSTPRPFGKKERRTDMAPSRSPLNRQSIAQAMTELLGPDAVETGHEQLRAAKIGRAHV